MCCSVLQCVEVCCSVLRTHLNVFDMDGNSSVRMGEANGRSGDVDSFENATRRTHRRWWEKRG